MPRASARSSRGSIGSRARSGAAHSRSVGISRSNQTSPQLPASNSQRERLEPSGRKTRQRLFIAFRPLAEQLALGVGSWELGVVGRSPSAPGPRATPEAQEPQRAAGTLNEGVTAVLVDVVVRDRRGQPVRDLTQADFEVLEDGVPQTIGSFTPIWKAAPATTAPPAAPAVAPPAPPAALRRPQLAAGPAVTAMVFHGLSPEGRKRAVQAARAYLGDKEEMQNYIGIFGIDLSLSPVVPFTRNGYAVRQALDRIASGSTAGFNAPEQQQQRANAESAAASAGRSRGRRRPPARGAGNSGAVGTAAGDAKLAQMAAGAAQGLRGHGARSAGLHRHRRAVRASSARSAGVPGRKSVVLFSEGIAIPQAVPRLFFGVIDAANRANVSIYTIDAAGLRARKRAAEGPRHGRPAPAPRARAATRRTPAAGRLSATLEMNEDALRSDPASRPHAARARDRRPGVQQHQQPEAGLRADRQRSPQLLHARLYADQQRLRRKVPRRFR